MSTPPDPFNNEDKRRNKQQPSVEDASDDDSGPGINTPTSSTSSNDGHLNPEAHENLNPTDVTGGENTPPSSSEPNVPNEKSANASDDGEKTPSSSPGTDGGSNDGKDNEKRDLSKIDKDKARSQIMGVFRTLFPNAGFLSEHIITEVMIAVKKYLVDLPKQMYKQVKEWKDNNPKTFWFIVICVVLGISLPVTAHLIGFTAGGIAAGSIAAGIHAGIGNVVAGSAFAIMQSITATGLLASLSLGFGAGIPALFLAFRGGLQKDGWLRKFCENVSGQAASWWGSWFRK